MQRFMQTSYLLVQALLWFLGVFPLVNGYATKFHVKVGCVNLEYQERDLGGTYHWKNIPLCAGRDVKLDKGKGGVGWQWVENGYVKVQACFQAKGNPHLITRAYECELTGFWDEFAPNQKKLSDVYLAPDYCLYDKHDQRLIYSKAKDIVGYNCSKSSLRIDKSEKVASAKTPQYPIAKNPYLGRRTA